MWGWRSGGFEIQSSNQGICGIDAALASACLVTMIAVAVYAIGHYAMF